ncbi:MAG: ribosome small subunit-dependent GTPase A [Gammaproteobacteria bacterium]|nr:ribosome small subunit-dependent GTPase A [Gammaproteobacteria bacterium]
MASGPPSSSEARYNGTVISHFGNEILIQSVQGERLRAIPRQQLPALATGDRIHYETGEAGHAVIDEVAPRHGILTRHSKQQDKLVAVNIDKVLIICAAKPACKTGLIDRYLVACEQAGLDAMIVFNKIDLLDARKLETTRTELAVYERIGYRVFYVSAKQGEGIDALTQSLVSATSVLVGHSAVGKSSLIKSLIPTSAPRIGEVSKSTNKGQHTTTHTELYQTGNEGLIIDSPGIREFGIKPMDAPQLAQGFREFVPYIEQCKFRNCTHTNEPGCAIIQAVRDERIYKGRYDSYKAILNSFAEAS